MHHRARNLEEKGAATSATSAALDSVSLTPVHSYRLASIFEAITHVSVVMEGTAVTST